jgi:hypothetical protein
MLTLALPCKFNRVACGKQGTSGTHWVTTQPVQACKAYGYVTRVNDSAAGVCGGTFSITTAIGFAGYRSASTSWVLDVSKRLRAAFHGLSLTTLVILLRICLPNVKKPPDQQAGGFFLTPRCSAPCKTADGRCERACPGQ